MTLMVSRCFDGMVFFKRRLKDTTFVNGPAALPTHTRLTVPHPALLNQKVSKLKKKLGTSIAHTLINSALLSMLRSIYQLRCIKIHLNGWQVDSSEVINPLLSFVLTICHLSTLRTLSIFGLFNLLHSFFTNTFKHPEI